MTAPLSDLTDAIDAAKRAYQAGRDTIDHRHLLASAVRAAAEVLIPQVQAAERERIARAIKRRQDSSNWDDCSNWNVGIQAGFAGALEVVREQDYA